jgi:peptidylprolyl isomerase
MNKFIAWSLITLMLAVCSEQVNANDMQVEKTIREGKRFLKKNKKDSSVIVKRSGLQYQIIVKGEGTSVPDSDDQVTVHYHVTFLNGDVFDSSMDRGRPIIFKLNQVMPGWKQGIQYMVTGDKFRFFIPSHLAYGKKKFGEIPPGSLLIFEIELLTINP